LSCSQIWLNPLVTDQRFWSNKGKKKKKKTLLLRGHLAALGGDSRAVIIIFILFYFCGKFSQHTLGRNFRPGLARKPKSAVGSPISSTKIEASRDQTTTCPTLEKKGRIKK
jgi:hypothetical protein